MWREFGVQQWFLMRFPNVTFSWSFNLGSDSSTLQSIYTILVFMRFNSQSHRLSFSGLTLLFSFSCSTCWKFCRFSISTVKFYFRDDYVSWARSRCPIINRLPLQRRLRSIICEKLHRLLILILGENVSSLNPVNFSLSVLINEFFCRDKASTNSDKNVIASFNLNKYFTWAKLINSLGLSQKQYFKLFFFRVSVDKGCQRNIYFVNLFWNIKIELLIAVLKMTHQVKDFVLMIFTKLLNMSIILLELDNLLTHHFIVLHHINFHSFSEFYLSLLIFNFII